jgi:hypothetical protein
MICPHFDVSACALSRKIVGDKQILSMLGKRSTLKSAPEPPHIIDQFHNIQSPSALETMNDMEPYDMKLYIHINDIVLVEAVGNLSRLYCV